VESKGLVSRPRLDLRQQNSSFLFQMITCCSSFKVITTDISESNTRRTIEPQNPKLGKFYNVHFLGMFLRFVEFLEQEPFNQNFQKFWERAKSNRMKIPNKKVSKVTVGYSLRGFNLFSGHFGKCHFN